MTPASMPWWNTILPGKIILGAIPLSNYGHADAIANEAHCVLTLLESFEIESETWFSVPVKHSEWMSRQVAHQVISCKDFQALSQTQIRRSIAYMHLHISQGDVVYTHCKAGRGRSATVVICYILKYWNTLFPNSPSPTVDSAIAFVKSKRPVINLNASQRAAIHTYFESL